MDEEFTETSISSYPITRGRIRWEYNFAVDCSSSHVRWAVGYNFVRDTFVLKDVRGLPQSSHDKNLKQVMPETFLYIPIQPFPNHPTIIREMTRKFEKNIFKTMHQPLNARIFLSSCCSLSLYGNQTYLKINTKSYSESVVFRDWKQSPKYGPELIFDIIRRL